MEEKKVEERFYFIFYRKKESEEVDCLPIFFRSREEAVKSDEWQHLAGTTKKIIMIPIDPLSI